MSSGNVGIGTTTPGALLDVWSTNQPPGVYVSTFLNASDNPLLSPAVGMFTATWDSPATMNGTTLVAELYVNDGAPTYGAPGALVGGITVNKHALVDSFGILGIINNGPLVDTPNGTAVWALVRGTKATGGYVSALYAPVKRNR